MIQFTTLASGMFLVTPRRCSEGVMSYSPFFRYLKHKDSRLVQKEQTELHWMKKCEMESRSSGWMSESVWSHLLGFHTSQWHLRCILLTVVITMSEGYYCVLLEPLRNCNVCHTYLLVLPVPTIIPQRGDRHAAPMICQPVSSAAKFVSRAYILWPRYLWVLPNSWLLIPCSSHGGMFCTLFHSFNAST